MALPTLAVQMLAVQILALPTLTVRLLATQKRKFVYQLPERFLLIENSG
jgi:hypothetical protein